MCSFGHVPVSNESTGSRMCCDVVFYGPCSHYMQKLAEITGLVGGLYVNQIQFDCQKIENERETVYI